MLASVAVARPYTFFYACLGNSRLFIPLLKQTKPLFGAMGSADLKWN
jgi:hypothetical protein